MSQVVIVKDVIFEAAKNKVPNYGVFSVGRVDNPPVGKIVTVWTDGKNGTRLQFNPVSSVVSVVSTSASDTFGGSGVNTVRILGRNNGVSTVQDESVNMNGTTPVTTIAAYDNIDIVQGSLLGVAEGAVGRISCTISGSLQANVEIGDATSLKAANMVFSNNLGFMLRTSYSADGPAEFFIFLKSTPLTFAQPYRQRDSAFVDNGTVVKDFSETPITITANTGVEWAVRAHKPNLTCIVTRTFLFLPNELT